MANSFDDKTPVSFYLPDGDVAKLVTWAYIENKLDTELTTTLDQIESINTQLTRIRDRIDEWITVDDTE